MLDGCTISGTDRIWDLGVSMSPNYTWSPSLLKMVDAWLRAKKENCCPLAHCGTHFPCPISKYQAVGTDSKTVQGIPARAVSLYENSFAVRAPKL